MKRIIIGTMAVMMTVTCFAADGDNVLTSKPYVDDAVSTRQDKIPAANPSNTNLGETVMTYTDTGNGEIGERELFTGGTYDAATDGDKLITASALKAAFTLPETQTTKLVCANPGTCDLWTITNQTAYGHAAATTIDLSVLVNIARTGACGKLLSDGTIRQETTLSVPCLITPASYGEWGAVFPYNDGTIQVSGISACSAVNENLSFGGIPTNQSGVQADYESNMTAAPTSAPAGGYCYCKMTDPNVSTARWYSMDNPSLFAIFGAPTASGCAESCAFTCALNARYPFGTQQ